MDSCSSSRVSSDLQSCRQLQQQALHWLQAGKFPEALNCHSKVLRLARSRSGEKSPEARTTSEEFCRAFITTLDLTCTDLQARVHLLAEFVKVIKQTDESSTAALCDVFLALSRACRGLSRAGAAQHFAMKALRLAQSSHDPRIDRATLCLSVCAALADASDSRRALKYAKMAVHYAKADLDCGVGDWNDKLKLLSVGCHNAGVQEERMEHFDTAIRWFGKAVTVLELRGNESHMTLLAEMRKSLSAALRSNLRRLQRSLASLPSATFPKRDLSITSCDTSPKLQNRTALSQGQSMLSSPYPEAKSRHLRRLIVSGCSTTLDTPRDAVSVDFRTVERKLLQCAATRLQAFFRAWRTRRDTQLLRRRRELPRLLFRGGQKLAGKFVVVSVSDKDGAFAVVATSMSGGEVRVTASKGLTAAGAARAFERLRAERAAVCAQRWIRGFLVRCRSQLLRRRAGARLLFRGALCVDGVCVHAIVVRRSGRTLMVVGGREVALPHTLSVLPAQQLVRRLRSAATLRSCELLDPRTPPVEPVHTQQTLRNNSLGAAAVMIQKHIRGVLARRQTALLRLRIRRYAYRGFIEQLDSGVLCSVFFLRDKEAVVAEVRRLDESLICEERLADVGCDLSDLFARIELRGNTITLAPGSEVKHRAAQKIQKMVRGVLTRMRFRELLRKSKRRLQFFAVKVVDSETFHLAIYLLIDKVQIETFKLYTNKQLKYRAHSVFYSLEEIEKMYGCIPPWEQLFDDILIKDEALVVRPQRKLEGRLSVQSAVAQVRLSQVRSEHSEARSIVRTSRKLDERLWVVTMHSVDAEGLMEFTAFCSGQQPPLKVQARLEELATAAGLPAKDVWPVGVTAIQKMLKLEDGVLTLDLAAKVPNMTQLTVKIQACVRGFLTRRRLHGQSKKSNLVTCTVLRLDEQDWVLYAYRVLSDILICAIKRRSDEKAFLKIPGTLFLKFPPSLGTKRILESLIFPKVALREQDGSKPGQSYVLQRVAPLRRRTSSAVPSTPRTSSRGSESPFPRPSIRTSPLQRFLRALPRAQTTVQKPLRPAEQLVLRSLAEFGGHAYLASIYQTPKTFIVELRDQATGRTLRRTVQATVKGKGVEARCEELLNSIEVREGEIHIREAEVMYRCSLPLRDRLFHVTIVRTATGVRMSAFDSAGAALQLEVGLQDPSPQELHALVGRLTFDERGLLLSDPVD